MGDKQFGTSQYIVEQKGRFLENRVYHNGV